MDFEIQLIKLLKKKGDISKEIVDLINSLDFKEQKLTISNYVLNQIRERLTDAELEDLWNSILSSFDISHISDEIIEYLIENKISLLMLCHLDLLDKWLLKLIDYDDAPIYTISKRYYLSDEYSLDQFEKFYNSYLCKYNYVALHLLEFYDFSTKRELLKYLCFNDNSFSEKETLNQYFIADRVKTLIDSNEITSFYKECSKSSKVLLSIANNYFTPEDILKELSTIKNIKCAFKIRASCRENLRIRSLKQSKSKKTGKTGDDSLC